MTKKITFKYKFFIFLNIIFLSLSFFPYISFGAEITFINPTFGDMPPGQNKSSTVNNSTSIGIKGSYITSAIEFCDTLSYSYVNSEIDILDVGTYWHTGNLKWQKSSTANLFNYIICDNDVESSLPSNLVYQKWNDVNIGSIPPIIFFIFLSVLSFGIVFILQTGEWIKNKFKNFINF